MNVLVIADIYPSQEEPFTGVFVKEEVEQLRRHHEVRVMVVGRRHVRAASREFLRILFKGGIGQRGAADGEEEHVSRIDYPVLEYPAKVSSFNLDKLPSAGGTLLGIKGQYLIFDAGVINMRKYGGYQLSLTLEN